MTDQTDDYDAPCWFRMVPAQQYLICVGMKEMMHADQLQPLSVAAGVLAASTLASVRRSPSYHRRGWQILDRWAFTSPVQLRALEAQGEVILLGKLLEQQHIC